MKYYFHEGHRIRPAGEQQHGPYLRGAGSRDPHPGNGGRRRPRLLSDGERCLILPSPMAARRFFRIHPP